MKKMEKRGKRVQIVERNIIKRILPKKSSQTRERPKKPSTFNIDHIGFPATFLSFVFFLFLFFFHLSLSGDIPPQPCTWTGISPLITVKYPTVLRNISDGTSIQRGVYWLPSLVHNLYSAHETCFSDSFIWEMPTVNWRTCICGAVSLPSPSQPKQQDRSLMLGISPWENIPMPCCRRHRPTTSFHLHPVKNSIE